MEGRILTPLVTEDVIINFSPVSKLEEGVKLGPGLLLKNNILKCFRWVMKPFVLNIVL